MVNFTVLEIIARLVITLGFFLIFKCFIEVMQDVKEAFRVLFGKEKIENSKAMRIRKKENGFVLRSYDQNYNYLKK